ncbi:MAG: DUF11 domain-containing protein, partial [bacterium]|nr:DUF11 domain-containing protein [bacterium]
DTSEIYDPATESWTVTGDLVEHREQHVAALLPNGHVLVAAGYTGTLLASADVYDPGAGTWKATGSMAVARYSPSASVLADGSVRVTGAADLSTEATTTEIYELAGDAVRYDVYFGSAPAPPLVASDQPGAVYHPGTLATTTDYYWRIVAKDSLDTVSSGPEWTFMTVCDAIITLLPGALPAAIEGQSYHQTITAGGGTAPYGYAVTAGALPPGLELSSGGVLSEIPTTPGSYEFTVTATDFIGCQGSLGYSLGVTPSAELTIVKTDGQATAVPGQGVTYVITVFNAGPSAVTGAIVTDTFPAALTGVSWSCAGSGGGLCTAGGASPINDSVDLPAAASVTYTASGTVDPAATGTLQNTATVAAPGGVHDPNPGNNSASDSDSLTPEADLGITKTDGQTEAVPGEEVTYTITVTNPGPSAAPGTTVADAFPTELSGVSWSCAGSGGGLCTAGGSGDVNDVVDLPAGGAVTYTATGTIDPTATGTLENTATVTAPGGVPDPNGTNDSATDSDTLTPEADLGITKTDNQTSAVPGE